MSPLLKKSAFLPSRLKRSPIILLIRALKIDGAIPMRTESIIFLSKEMDTFGMRAFLEVYSRFNRWFIIFLSNTLRCLVSLFKLGWIFVVDMSTLEEL